MEIYDLIMLAVLALATMFGAWKGLAWQVASLSSIFVSFFVASRFRAPAAALIDAAPPWNAFLAMLVLFLGTSLAIWVAFRMVSELIDRVKLKEFDRHAGAVAGFARGVLWCAIITLFGVTLLSQTQQEAIVRSRSGYYIAMLLDRATAVMPAELHEVLAPYLDTLDERLEPDQRLSSGRDSGVAAGTAEPSERYVPPLQIADPASADGGDAIQRWLQKLPQQP